MREASEAFGRVVLGSHQAVTRLDVLYGGLVVEEGLAVVEGTVNYDRNAAHLATLTCTIADPVRVPVTPTSVLTPFGYELRVWRGVLLAPGVEELVPLGTFPIQQSKVGAVTLVSSISATDRSKKVSDARLEDDYQVAAGTNYATAIEDFLEFVVPGLEYLFPSVSYTTPLLTFAAQSDPWELAQGMARAIGYELFFDGLGRVVLRPEPSFGTVPAATIVEGSNLLALDLSLDRATAYNRVVAFSTNASLGAQYRGVATDDDPASPTYYYGGFGRKPRFYASEFLASDAQAETAAQAILASGLGVAKSVDFAALPDPRLECSDVVLVTATDLEVDSLHIIDTLSIGLGPEVALTGNSRAQVGASTIG